MSDRDRDRSLIGRIGAHALHASVEDETAFTAPARKAFMERFEREVDPDGILLPEERARRAEHARKAYFLILAKKSAAVRSRNKGSKARVKCKEHKVGDPGCCLT